MPVAVCPSCDRKLKAPEGAEGRKLRCPGCSATLLVSGGELSLVPEPITGTRAGRPERRSRPDDEDDRPRRSRRSNPDDDDYEEDRPRKRRRSEGGGIPLWVWIAGGGGLLAVGGLVLVLILVLGGGGYDKIKDGMSETEVKDIMGKPDLEVMIQGNGSMSWKKSDKLISVLFEKGKVVKKMKLDPKEMTKDMGKFP
jgi:Zn-finger nucleic acid-binding protein